MACKLIARQLRLCLLNLHLGLTLLPSTSVAFKVQIKLFNIQDFRRKPVSKRKIAYPADTAVNDKKFLSSFFLDSQKLGALSVEPCYEISANEFL